MQVDIAKIQPTHSRVLIKRIFPPEMSSGGLILASTLGMDERGVWQGLRRDLATCEAEVVSVGPGSVFHWGRESVPIAPGDRVVVWPGMDGECQIDEEHSIVDLGAVEAVVRRE